MQARRALYLSAVAIAAAALALSVHGQGPPSCAPAAADDVTILLSFSLPNAEEGAMFGDIKCNGQECSVVPSTEYAGILISQRSFDTCPPNNATIEFADADLTAFLISAELIMGNASSSSSSSDDTISIDTAGIVSGVAGITPLLQGTGTVSLFALTDTYYRKPVMDSEGKMGCAADDKADGSSMIDSLLGTLPPFQTAGLPLDPWTEQPQICVYSCTSLIAAIEFTSLCDGSVSGTELIEIPPLQFAAENQPDPLSSESLQCKVGKVDLGPFVSPTKKNDKVTVNGKKPGPVCNAQGAQLGALVVEGECSACCTNPPCTFKLDLEAKGVKVEKTFDVGKLKVGSSVKVSLKEQMLTSTVTQKDMKSQFNLYVWSSTYFRCAASAPGATPMCPKDPNADIGPQLIANGLPAFFNDTCPESPPGKIPVCLYVCLEARAIECLFPCEADENSVGKVISVNPVYEEGGFLKSKTISDPHFQGFYGQTYDFHGQPGKIYHILSEHPDFESLDRPVLSVNALFGQAYATSLSGDAAGQIHPYAPKSGATWLTEVGIQYGSSCIVVGSKAGVAASASADFEIAYGSLQVDGIYMARTGSYDFGGFNMSVENKKSFVRIAIFGDALVMSLDIVSPPRSWDVDSSMIGELTHININVDKILLRHGLGVMGLSSVGKNSELNSSMLAPREADFEMQELCSLPAADRIARLD